VKGLAESIVRRSAGIRPPAGPRPIELRPRSRFEPMSGQDGASEPSTGLENVEYAGPEVSGLVAMPNVHIPNVSQSAPDRLPGMASLPQYSSGRLSASLSQKGNIKASGVDEAALEVTAAPITHDREGPARLRQEEVEAPILDRPMFPDPSLAERRDAVLPPPASTDLIRNQDMERAGVARAPDVKVVRAGGSAESVAQRDAVAQSDEVGRVTISIGRIAIDLGRELAPQAPTAARGPERTRGFDSYQRVRRGKRR